MRCTVLHGTIFLLWMLSGWSFSGDGAAASPPAAARGNVIFVADGAGGKDLLTSNLALLASEKLPGTRVVSVNWSSVETGRDIGNQALHATHARQLAYGVHAVKQANPTTNVYLVGWGAGTSICLQATRYLPAGSVDRIFLLSPRVASDYDLRPALGAARGGIDVYYHPEDAFLTATTDCFGTSDGSPAAAAGSVGFRPPITGTGDYLLYSRLRQHPLETNHWGFGTLRVVDHCIVSQLR